MFHYCIFIGTSVVKGVHGRTVKGTKDKKITRSQQLSYANDKKMRFLALHTPDAAQGKSKDLLFLS